MGAGASFEVFAPGELEGEMQAMDAATSSSSSWEMFKAGYDTIVHTIIRPPRRHEYSEGVALGPTCFDADDGTTISRRDFTTLNAHNEALRCSVWDSEAGRVTTAQSSDIGWQIPSFVVSAGIALLRSTIKRTAGFDLHAVAPRDGIAHASVPAVFVHGVQDSFVPVRHSSEKASSTGGRPHVVYTVSVFAPAHLFAQLPPAASNVFGVKEKESEGRLSQDTVPGDEQHEIKSLWQSFRAQTKRAPIQRRSSWFGGAWRQNATGEEDAATFEVDRRFHDIKLLLTKLSALPGGLPNDLQTIRMAIGSKLVYSTKLGTARLDERVQLLNATLQVVCSSWTLWNHPMVLQFLSLQDVSMMSKQ
ncbi:hypothetical protein DYB25_006958 [Aphanomyces astaci]|uniref:Serine aminopeptidase S33 domain-containing protein n=1 Tax=Aphanomyces astaci TaxID=112090 RepID=A0A397C135_APHAT|nr:hypothetical protein DYB25_006958 [Aphanomyces astaci]RHZ19368.1 hypothetical protein DYB26_001381 [Aphanomyces astaci]